MEWTRLKVIPLVLRFPLVSKLKLWGWSEQSFQGQFICFLILYDEFNPGTMVTTHFQCAMGLNLKSNTIHGSSLLFVCLSALTFFLCHSGFPSPQKKQNIQVSIWYPFWPNKGVPPGLTISRAKAETSYLNTLSVNHGGNWTRISLCRPALLINN